MSKKKTSTRSTLFDFAFKKISEPVTVIAQEASIRAPDGADSIELDVQSESSVIDRFDGHASESDSDGDCVLVNSSDIREPRCSNQAIHSQ